MIRKALIPGIIGCAFLIGCNSHEPSGKWTISGDENKIVVQAGMLERSLRLTNFSIVTEMFTVNGNQVITENPDEFSVTFWKALPDAEPQGVGYYDKGGVEQEDAVKNQTDALNVAKTDNVNSQAVEWIDPVLVTGKQCGSIFDSVSYSVSFPDNSSLKTWLNYWKSIK